MSKNRSNSLWYPRYVGDYQRKTSHLSLTEHGVYALLLDHYYATGKPLPANAVQLQRVCRAFAPHDVDAMHNVLREFFAESAEGYRNYRADEELSKRCNISEKRRDAANSRHANAGANAGANAYTATATATKDINRRARTSRDEEYSTEFESVWHLIPKKVDKAATYAEFNRRLKTDGLDLITSRVGRWREMCKGREQKYIPSPAKWFRNRKWEDEGYQPVSEEEASLERIEFAKRAL